MQVWQTGYAAGTMPPLNQSDIQRNILAEFQDTSNFSVPRKCGIIHKKDRNFEIQMQTTRSNNPDKLQAELYGDFLQQENNNQPSCQNCPYHTQKKLEAFCDSCKQLLCIECILTQAHKNHEILSIEIGCKKEIETIQISLELARQKRNELENQIFTIRSHLKEIEINANTQREQISQIFREVRQKVIEREQLLKKRISEILEAEQILFKQRIQSLEQQIRCIDDLKAENQKIKQEQSIQTLMNSRFRQDLQKEANKRQMSCVFRNIFGETNREDEIACIVKQILPKKLRPTLLSSTLTSQIRRKRTQEDHRKRELHQNQLQLQLLVNSQPQGLSQFSSARGASASDRRRLLALKRSNSQDGRSVASRNGSSKSQEFNVLYRKKSSASKYRRDYLPSENEVISSNKYSSEVNTNLRARRNFKQNIQLSNQTKTKLEALNTIVKGQQYSKPLLKVDLQSNQSNYKQKSMIGGVFQSNNSDQYLHLKAALSSETFD